MSRRKRSLLARGKFECMLCICRLTLGLDSTGAGSLINVYADACEEIAVHLLRGKTVPSYFFFKMFGLIRHEEAGQSWEYYNPNEPAL